MDYWHAFLLLKHKGAHYIVGFHWVSTIQGCQLRGVPLYNNPMGQIISVEFS